ncbi:MAG: rhamnulokinase [Armatimonadota bacterium]
MATGHKYLAIDLGASSGRAIIGSLDNGKLHLEEVHRFHNGPVVVNGHSYWDAFRLLEEIKLGISIAYKTHGDDIAGIGIDTWGVDFGLLGPNDILLEMPRHYRDSRTDGIIEKAEQILPRREIYAQTGIQLMQFNTLFQLLAISQENRWMLDCAQSLLMMPDLLSFWLTGIKANEFTETTTSQMYNPVIGGWATDLLAKMSLPSHILGRIVQPGSVLGTLTADVASETHSGPIPVIAVASHDTGSAVAAVPRDHPDSAYISSGTWCLVGIESPSPIIDDHAFSHNFTNEGGVGSFRFLCNVMGLWLVQECRRTWAEAGREFSFAELADMAANAAPFQAVIDPDDPSFFKPGDMPARIREFCSRTGQPIPESEGEVVRTALEGVALKCRWALEAIETSTGRPIPKIHIVGGGTQNKLLCKLTADVTGKPVLAGPVEATAIGNIIVQAIGLGHISSLDGGREIIRNSFELEAYDPQGSPRIEDAYGKLKSLIGV